MSPRRKEFKLSDEDREYFGWVIQNSRHAPKQMTMACVLLDMDEGWAPWEILERNGVTYGYLNTVRRRYKEYGQRCLMDGRSSLLREIREGKRGRNNEIRQKRKEGRTLVSLGEEYGLTAAMVARVCDYNKRNYRHV